jgi:predicted acetyltransferase
VIAFRRATEDDLERLVTIHTSAFPDPRSFEARERNFTKNRFGALHDLRVAVRDGEIVAHAFLFAFEVGFGGARVRAGGIASVGVAPEARGSGVGAALLAHLHDEANARGDALTILFAFRQGFYARHGYAAATPTRRLVFSPASIPRAWGGAVRAAAGDRAAIAAAYDRALARTTGWLARDERAWEPLLLDERRSWIVAERNGAVSGYVAWSLAQSEAHAKTTLHVREIVADDEASKRALFAAIGAQRDQISECTLTIADDDPILFALSDADRARFGTADAEHVLGEIHAGPMVRVVDVRRAISARAYRADGELTFGCGETVSVRVASGRASFGGSGPTIRLDRATLGAILYGALRPSDAAHLGLLDADASTVLLADRIVALAPYFALDPF